MVLSAGGSKSFRPYDLAHLVVGRAERRDELAVFPYGLIGLHGCKLHQSRGWRKHVKDQWNILHFASIPTTFLHIQVYSNDFPAFSSLFIPLDSSFSQ